MFYKDNLDLGFGGGKGISYSAIRWWPDQQNFEGVIPIESIQTDKPADVLRRELSKRSLVYVANLADNTSVEYTVYNPESKGLKIALPGFSDVTGTKCSREEQRRQQDLAILYPDDKIVTVSNAGFGNSSKLPKATVKQMVERGSYAPQGQIVLKALNGVINNSDGNIKMTGRSLGGRIATGIAAAVAENSDVNKRVSLQLIDPVGTRKTSCLKLGRAFVIEEPTLGSESKKYSPYVDLDPLDSGLIGSGSMAVYRITRSVLMAANAARTMSQPGFSNDLMAAQDAIADLTIASPSESRLNDPETMRGIVENASGINDRLWLRLNGQSHFSILNYELGNSILPAVYVGIDKIRSGLVA